MARIQTTCEECNVALRSRETYVTTDDRKLCEKCFSEWLDEPTEEIAE